jgi:hypothetical protein
MDNKIVCIIKSKKLNRVFTGKADLKDLDITSLLSNSYNSNPITIQLGDKTISGVISEILVKNNRVSNNVVKIILE